MPDRRRLLHPGFERFPAKLHRRLPRRRAGTELLRDLLQLRAARNDGHTRRIRLLADPVRDHLPGREPAVSDQWLVRSEEEVEALIGKPTEIAKVKIFDHVDEYAAAFIARSPL